MIFKELSNDTEGKLDHNLVPMGKTQKRKMNEDAGGDFWGKKQKQDDKTKEQGNTSHNLY